MSNDTKQALSQAIAAHVTEPGELTGSWVLITEILNPETVDRSTWHIESEGSAISTRGLIEYARDTYKHENEE